ncbi:MAG: NUDIX domain-containing protein [Candidatus Thiodiazotropha sp.]
MSAFDYCPGCGRMGLTWSEGKRWKCGECGFIYYHNMAAAVAAVLLCDDRILLSVRKHDPARGLLDLPGGFVDPNETLEQALTREIQEELGVDVAMKDWRYLFSFPNRYEFAGISYATSDAFFLKRFAVEPQLRVADDVEDGVWTRLSQLDPGEMGLTSVRRAMQELQRRQRLGELNGPVLE